MSFLSYAYPELAIPIYVGTWAGRPTPSASNAGQQIQITDYGAGGRSYWWSDGTYWRPVNGRVCLASLTSTKASPIATVAGNGTEQFFSLPTVPTLPSGMRYPGMRLRLSWLIGRTVLAGAPLTLVGSGAQLATVPGSGGTAVSAVFTISAVVQSSWLESELHWNSTSDIWTAFNYQGASGGASPLTNMTDAGSGALPQTSDLYVRARVDLNAIAGDTVALYRLGVSIEG